MRFAPVVGDKSVTNTVYGSDRFFAAVHLKQSAADRKAQFHDWITMDKVAFRIGRSRSQYLATIRRREVADDPPLTR